MGSFQHPNPPSPEPGTLARRGLAARRSGAERQRPRRPPTAGSALLLNSPCSAPTNRDLVIQPSGCAFRHALVSTEPRASASGYLVHPVHDLSSYARLRERADILERHTPGTKPAAAGIRVFFDLEQHFQPPPRLKQIDAVAQIPSVTNQHPIVLPHRHLTVFTLRQEFGWASHFHVCCME